ncbi:IclR family transcriptional regulator [Citricoccus sp. NR2]|uniref:IclR family transcriptional regulator n=1 Tax=Citricoccus sp. NR2 TaxID=3004095 RepID=UPI0022DD568B|nr:IclR family transcriptional regulator [Citricoccus sp. NR2]WBL19756.1 IclR family transcriptional regulator [Citricoccus sp. NR2]
MSQRIVREPSGRGSVTSRALSVLDTFEPGREHQTLSDISRRAGLPVATAHRLISELVDWGGLERKGKHYSVGQRIWALGHLAVMQKSLTGVAAPHMQDVLFITQNVVNLFVPEDNDVLLVERMSGSLVKVPFRRVGEKVSYNGSAGGKVLLAYAPDSVVEAVLESPARYTKKTLVSPGEIKRESRRVREQGFATSMEETAEGHYGLAVPITIGDGRVVAAIGVVTLAGPAPVGTVVPVLRIAARAIGRQLTLDDGGVWSV